MLLWGVFCLYAFSWQVVTMAVSKRKENLKSNKLQLIEHKLEMVNSRTVEAIEKIYGNDEQVSADLKNYFIK
ncbi:1-aminocyclopropane-1-carboxylate deaminase/D-cysteine desulfhydrase-like pyridoxal-dependent ACC family enzyme [Neobacillus niacini]|nr:1-aminocyclopropane-1-carboxylate deaminase/D-cysteine desulfhydrase-like pyridoxal-dependent ACC family enzyme [Neobacillus niacini]